MPRNWSDFLFRIVCVVSAMILVLGFMWAVFEICAHYDMLHRSEAPASTVLT